MVQQLYHFWMPPKIGKGVSLRGKVYWYRVQNGGQRSQISLGTSDPTEAIARVALVKTNGVLESRTTFDSEVDVFLAAKTALGRHTERSTQWFKETLRPFGSFIHNKPCAKVTADDIERFYAHMRTHLADTTAKGRMGAVRSFFSWAKKSKRRFDNPTVDFKTPRVANPARVIWATQKERDLLVKRARGDLRLNSCFSVRSTQGCASTRSVRLAGSDSPLPETVAL